MFCLVWVLIGSIFCTPCLAHGERMRIATTTSVEESGLLAALIPTFERAFAVRVNVIATGTGRALELGKNGDVDLVLVHAPELEERFVAEGYGVERRVLMENDFVIVGPPSDPAGVRQAKSAAEAFRRIAAGGYPFVSRGDGSGTHQREVYLWRVTGMRGVGRWYIEAGRGMGEVLMMAEEKGAYTLADSATYTVFKGEGRVDLPILFAGDPAMRNPYAVIAINPVRHPEVNYRMAQAFIDWLTSAEGKKIIFSFGRDRYGAPLFYPVRIKGVK